VPPRETRRMGRGPTGRAAERKCRIGSGVAAALSVVPCPGGLFRVHLPPTAATRSTRPCSRVPRFGSAPPWSDVADLDRHQVIDVADRRSAEMDRRASSRPPSLPTRRTKRILVGPCARCSPLRGSNLARLPKTADCLDAQPMRVQPEAIAAIAAIYLAESRAGRSGGGQGVRPHRKDSRFRRAARRVDRPTETRSLGSGAKSCICDIVSRSL